MKKIFNVLLVTMVGLYLISCSKEEDKIELNNTSQAKITSDKTSVVLDETKAGQNAMTVTWENPTFNPSVGFNNSLQFAVAGTSFATNVLQDLPLDQKTFSLTHLQLNNILAQLNVAPDTAKPIEVRMRTALNSTTFFYSNVVTVNMTGYKPNPDLIYPKINVPGGYAGAAGYADWEPTNSPNLFSPEKNDKYRGFIYVTNPNSEYKFTINQSYTGDKGDDGTFTGKLVETGEVNVKAVATGAYYINVNWAANTYSSVIANFGVIGDATPTGWGSDTDFVYNPATKTFVINSIALSSTGVFKFRANDDWAMKFQPKDADQTLVSGTAVQSYLSAENTVTGDPAYKVSQAGNYKIELDLHNSAYYKLTITKL
ncbi:SusE domain-containing protein [Chryseobacterium sp. ES2]|uniref:SusE domain-containing protein n=1 Tax=Chryseobacterium metallicongregator TaxID=3073042 RepID=A0ABU1EAC7_9FLAO|nr:SusE domain-containing protein [Chryseobacterium sp. ES2]MDR4954774.1 SusE domain-containing protein [Chryseobacterium sp. ES2]